MKTQAAPKKTVQISQDKLLSLVRVMLGGNSGRPDDENPLPPGPWDPVIRSALEKVRMFSPLSTPRAGFGPQMGPWKVALSSMLARRPEMWEVVGGGRGFGDEASLNPQPLPPRWAFFMALAQTVVSRAELMQEIAASMRSEGEKQGIIIVSGYVSRFADEFCGTGVKLRYPFPGPRPHWFTSELDGADLVVMAAEFESAAGETYSPELGKALSEASAKLVTAGLAMM